jgi:hypothetical protein
MATLADLRRSLAEVRRPDKAARLLDRLAQFDPDARVAITVGTKPKPPAPMPIPLPVSEKPLSTRPRRDEKPSHMPQGKPIGKRQQPDNSKRIGEGGGLRQTVVKDFAHEHVHSARCANCRRWFLSMQSAKTCSGKCRVALHRKRAARG